MEQTMWQLIASVMHNEELGNISTRLRKCEKIIAVAQNEKVIAYDVGHRLWVQTKGVAQRMATHQHCHDVRDLVRAGLAA